MPAIRHGARGSPHRQIGMAWRRASRLSSGGGFYPPRLMPPTGRNPSRKSELQAAFASRVGQGLDAAVVAVARTIERNLFDAGSLGLLGDRATDLGGGLGVLAVLQAVLD